MVKNILLILVAGLLLGGCTQGKVLKFSIEAQGGGDVYIYLSPETLVETGDLENTSSIPVDGNISVPLVP